METLSGDEESYPVAFKRQQKVSCTFLLGFCWALVVSCWALILTAVLRKTITTEKALKLYTVILFLRAVFAFLAQNLICGNSRLYFWLYLESPLYFNRKLSTEKYVSINSQYPGLFFPKPVKSVIFRRALWLINCLIIDLLLLRGIEFEALLLFRTACPLTILCKMPI